MVWNDGKPERVRDFTWADHVNDFWDEALNPNAHTGMMRRHLERWLLGLCDVYRAHPERFVVADWDALFERYRHIGLIDTRELRPEVFFPQRCEALVDRGAVVTLEPAVPREAP